MPKVAISYRRSDTAIIAGRIFDHLVSYYGDGSVFMDIDDIPFGTDFRTHIHDTLEKSDVLIALIGSAWLGLNADGETRIRAKADPVRAEIATALDRKLRIIPVLIDGAKMPADTDLPPELENFAYLNAADVSSGRDFRSHMDRLINAIDGALTGEKHAAATRPVVEKSPTGEHAAIAQKSWPSDTLRYFAVPLVLLLVLHHAIVNAFDLNVLYLKAACVLVPGAAGFAMWWLGRHGAAAACVFAVTLGLVAVVGMTISEGLSSGDPILPQTRFEWLDNVNFATIIAVSFVVGHTLARAVRARFPLKQGSY